MTRIAFTLTCFLSSICAAQQQTIAVQIKGYDDGIKTSVQQDYKEAVLFAKREAIERAGVKVTSLTTMEDFIVQSDYIESQAEAVLEPGYSIVDIGYQNDDTYLVVLTGTVSYAKEDSSIEPTKQWSDLALVKSLTKLAESPDLYEYRIGKLGTYSITKAYFANDSQFAIHYGFKNGVMTLNDIDKGFMQVSGRYQTDSDSGSVSMDFDHNGTAQGRWKTLILISGNIEIALKQPAAVEE